MADEKNHYSRYYIVRGLLTMWGGDPAQAGSPFREFVITSNEFVATDGIFQVYGLEAASGGIKDGKLASSAEPKLIFDKEFNGLDAAAKEFDKLVQDSKKRGFQERSVMEMLEFEDKLRRARGGA